MPQFIPENNVVSSEATHDVLLYKLEWSESSKKFPAINFAPQLSVVALSRRPRIPQRGLNSSILHHKQIHKPQTDPQNVFRKRRNRSITHISQRRRRRGTRCLQRQHDAQEQQRLGWQAKHRKESRVGESRSAL
jgi:hypothetical protein